MRRVRAVKVTKKADHKKPGRGLGTVFVGGMFIFIFGLWFFPVAHADTPPPTTPTPDPALEMLNALNLNLPALTAVRDAFQRGDTAAAKAAFVAHMRSRTQPALPVGHMRSRTQSALPALSMDASAVITTATANVLDFGADPTGKDDSGPAFNSALKTFRAVVVPAGTYLIKTPIVIPHWAMLFGQSGFLGGPKIKYHSDLGTNPMIWCQDTSWISFLSFEGPNKGIGTAIKNKKTNPDDPSYEDMDCTIHGCTFTNWKTAVEHWNRGLWFDSNASALVTASVSLNIDTASWVDDEDNPFDMPDQGFRAIRITNNRFHANTSAINNLGIGKEYLRGLSVIANQIDIGDTLFSGFCHTSLFTGNVIDQAGTTPLDFRGAVYGLTINGNTFGGDTPSGQNYPPYLIRFRNTANNISITGNTFRNAGTHGIMFDDALSQSSISGNTFYNIGVVAVSTGACIKTQSTFTNVTITGNSFFPVTAPFGVSGNTSGAWTNVIVDNNVWDKTKTLAAQYLETGTNYIQGQVVAAPTQLTATEKVRAVDLAWAAGSDNGGSGLGGYRVYVSKTADFSTFVEGWAGKDVGLATTVTVSGLTANTPYYARVRAYDGAGNVSEGISLLTQTLTEGLDTEGGLDAVRRYPTPFRPGHGAAGITFDHVPPQTTIRLYTVGGAQVKTLMTGSGTQVLWDITNDDGAAVSSGVYLAVIEKEGARQVMKVVVEK